MNDLVIGTGVYRNDETCCQNFTDNHERGRKRDGEMDGEEGDRWEGRGKEIDTVRMKHI